VELANPGSSGKWSLQAGRYVLHMVGRLKFIRMEEKVSTFLLYRQDYLNIKLNVSKDGKVNNNKQ